MCDNIFYNIYETVKKRYPAGKYGFELGWGTDNGGFERYSDEEKRITAPVPDQRVQNYLELEYYNFIHFGINTATGREWGTGKEDTKIFNPYLLDTDQWCAALKASGSKAIVFTAKHHDGFCLWPSKFTTHTVQYSLYKGGKGDIVAELAASCQKYGLKLGLYLSPWDMHEKTYGTKAYNDFFVSQLTELCTEYGEIFMFWFDGARGKSAQMDADFDYDFPRYYDVIKKYQPDAVTAILGEDVRWVGNEAGISRKSEWNVVPCEIDQKFQDSDKGSALRKINCCDEDIGSREVLSHYRNLVFNPAEVDVSIRRGWFYHKFQRPKGIPHLLRIYYKAVGGNSSLILNVPPDKKGLIDPKDVSTLSKLGAELQKRQGGRLFPAAILAGTAKEMSAYPELTRLTDDNGGGYILENGNYIIDFIFEKPENIDRVDLREDLRYSQRVEAFELWAKTADGWTLKAHPTVIGNRKTMFFKQSIQTDTLRLVIKQSRGDPALRSASFFGYTGGKGVKKGNKVE